MSGEIYTCSNWSVFGGDTPNIFQGSSDLSLLNMCKLVWISFNGEMSIYCAELANFINLEKKIPWNIVLIRFNDMIKFETYQW